MRPVEPVNTNQTKKRILIVFGTRPEAIKMAPLIKELEKLEGVDVKVCVTAQHRQMLDQVLTLFGIQPDFDLDIMRPDQQLGDLTINILKAVGTVIREFQPDIILVQGDTTTTFAATLSAIYEKVSVGHIEAGLRTGNKYSPWPEELNRRLTSVMTDIHFAPTELAKKNLLKEGVNPELVHVTGNTVIDALLEILERLKTDSALLKTIEEKFDYLDPSRKLILVTGHRRENFGAGFENICHALKELGQRDDIQIVYPVHLNPNVQEPVKRILGNSCNIHLVEPLDYLPFVYLLNRSYMILTDSGGIQEEAPSLGKPILVMRETTERSEGLSAGTVRLVGTDKALILKEAEKLLDSNEEYGKMARAQNPYGDGCASGRIANILSDFLCSE